MVGSRIVLGTGLGLNISFILFFLRYGFLKGNVLREFVSSFRDVNVFKRGCLEVKEGFGILRGGFFEGK